MEALISKQHQDIRRPDLVKIVTSPWHIEGNENMRLWDDIRQAIRFMLHNHWLEQNRTVALLLLQSTCSY